ncbi:MAG: heavy-metal-associated domain-containing protein [Ramlibacter sp.]
MPGVESVTVNFAAGNATVRFDETRIESADIKSAVRQRGIEPAAPADGPPGAAHEGHAAAGAPPAGGAPPAAAALASPPATPTAPAGTGSAPNGKPASSTTPDSAPAEPPATPAAAAGDDPKDKETPEKS